MNFIQGIEKVGRARWASFLAANAYASPFQSPDFYDFFNALPASQVAKVYAVEQENALQALCVVTLQKEKGLKGYFSRRAIVYGGPLLANNNPSALQLLLEKIEKDLRHQVIYLEMRNFHDYQPVFPIYEKVRWEYLAYLNVQLSLEGKTLEGILANMKYNRRREIRLSQTEGATCQVATNEMEVKDLYQILQELYQERVKVPLPSFAYFQQLFLSSVGKVLVVKHQEKVIGGAFCLGLEGQSIYTIYYCGIRDYHKKIFPTHLAVLGAIEYGLSHNMKWLDFMGAGLKGEEYGVRQYKMEFGGDLVEHGRFIKVFNASLYRLGKLGLNMLQKMKG